VLSGAGLATIAIAPSWPVALAGSVLLGAASGGMDTGFNAAAALRDDRRLMGLLHAGYGAGAAVGPIVVGSSLAFGGGWRPAYVGFAVVSLLLVIPMAGRDMGEAPDQHPMGTPRGMLLPCLAFFVYVALEITVGQWAFVYLTEHRGLSEFAASMFVGGYWISFSVGRLWLGVRSHSFSTRALLAASFAGAALGTLLLAFGGRAAPAGLAIAGLALSVVFPLLMSLTPAWVGPARATAAVGWQTAAASVGAAAGPAAAGVLLDAQGVASYGPITIALTVAVGAVVAPLAARPSEKFSLG
jgi:fucose permease